MKLLLSVITTLLQINGVMALVLILFVISLREQNAEMIAKVPQLHNNPERFRRDLQETESDYQKQIQVKDQKLQRYDQEIARLKAELETHKNINFFVQGITNARSSKSSVEQLQDPVVSVPRQLPQKELASAQGLRLSRNPSLTRSASGHSLQNPQPLKLQLSPSRTLNSPSMPMSGKVAPSRQDTEPDSSPITTPDSWEPQPLHEHDKIAVNIAPRAHKKTTNSPTTNPSLENAENSPREIRTQHLVAQTANESHRDQAIHLANDLTFGLIIAGQKQQINYGTRTYRQVQTAILSLRQGTSDDLLEASRRSRLNTSVLEQVAKWGASRPGGLLEEMNQISLANVEKTNP